MEYHFQDNIRAMFAPCCSHVWPTFKFLQVKPLKYSSLNQFGPWDISLECLFPHSTRAIFGPCQGNVFPRLALRLASSLKFSSLAHSGLQNTTMEYVICRTMQGHAWTLFKLTLIPGYIELLYF